MNVILVKQPQKYRLKHQNRQLQRQRIRIKVIAQIKLIIANLEMTIQCASIAELVQLVTIKVSTMK